jgi:hypothetical protein
MDNDNNTDDCTITAELTLDEDDIEEIARRVVRERERERLDTDAYRYRGQ